MFDLGVGKFNISKVDFSKVPKVSVQNKVQNKNMLMKGSQLCLEKAV